MTKREAAEIILEKIDEANRKELIEDLMFMKYIINKMNKLINSAVKLQEEVKWEK